jgi:hypothetical protein
VTPALLSPPSLWQNSDSRELPFPEEWVWHSWSLHEPQIQFLSVPTAVLPLRIHEWETSRCICHLSTRLPLDPPPPLKGGVRGATSQQPYRQPPPALPRESGQTALRCDCRLKTSCLPSSGWKCVEFNRPVKGYSSFLKESAGNKDEPCHRATSIRKRFQYLM